MGSPPRASSPSHFFLTIFSPHILDPCGPTPPTLFNNLLPPRSRCRGDAQAQTPITLQRRRTGPADTDGMRKQVAKRTLAQKTMDRVFVHFGAPRHLELSADGGSVCPVTTGHARTETPDSQARAPHRAALDDMAVIKHLTLARSRVITAARALANAETEGKPCEACRTCERQRAHIHMPCGRR